MAYIKEYCSDKEKRAEISKAHTAEMQKNWNNRIIDSIKNTKTYDTDFSLDKIPVSQRITTVELKDLDTVSAIFDYDKTSKEKIAVLNFSSYKNPGGGFINGSKAQEECLCHESFLYNVLKEKKDFYEWNQQHKNKALYLNRALYTSILFERKETYENYETITRRFCDVITCAAPNISAAQKYQNVSRKENTDVLKDRIKFVLDIAADNKVDVLILGAYGCGVFGQDAKEVAEIFKDFLTIFTFYLKNTSMNFS